MELNNTYLEDSLLQHSLYPTTTPPERLEDNTNVFNESQIGNGIPSTSYNADNNFVEEYGLEFPPGYRFCPSDGELIVYYLMNRIRDLTLPHNKIKDVNLYLTPPDILAAAYEPVEENEWYFFTPRDRKYPNGERPDRGVGRDKNKVGYWKATGADNNVAFQDMLVGFRKSLVYYQIQGNPPKGVKTNWIMHEYRIKEVSQTKRKRAHPNDMKLDDWVLCRIYNKSDKTTKSSTKPEMEKKSKPKSAKAANEDCYTKPKLEVKDEMPSQLPQLEVKDEMPSQLPHPIANMENMNAVEAEAMDDDFDIFSDKYISSFLDRDMHYFGSYDFYSQPMPDEEFAEEVIRIRKDNLRAVSPSTSRQS